VTTRAAEAPATSTTRRLSPGARRGLAAAAGILTALAFQPYNLWPLVVVGIGLLTVLVRGRRLREGFGAGYVFGVAFLALTVGWTYVIAVPVALLLVVVWALWFAGVGLVTTLVIRLPLWPLWVAAEWVLVEYLYSRIPWGGFGWTRLAFTQADSPLAGLFPYVATTGVSFLVALLGAGLAWAWVSYRTTSGRERLRAIAVVALAYVLAIGGAVVARAVTAVPQATDSITVGMVQGNVDGVGLEAFGRARSVTNNHMSQTVTLMAQARAGLVPVPDFVLWPENSTDIDPILDTETRQVVSTAVAVAGVPILVGAVTDGPGADERQTTALWWDPVTGPGAIYHKRNLVPFGEWIPLRQQLLPLVPMLKLVGAQSVPGNGPGVLSVDVPQHGTTRIGVLICFELAYDQTVREMISGDASTGGGAQIVTVQSNNATYAGTGQISQQWAITRIRAMETQREILVATTNALSGYIAPDGTVMYETRQRTPASTSVVMPVRNGLTPAMRFGAGIELALVFVAVAALAAAVWRSRPARGTASSMRQNGTAAST
jgi:apolipoprotein N-acyltransferase